MQLIGRKEEQEILARALSSSEAELVAIVGRRRVGKTFLVKQFYTDAIAFESIGVQNAPIREQLVNFQDQLSLYFPEQYPFDDAPPADWGEAFRKLRQALKAYLQQNDSKPVIFFDELPWLATHKSGFLRAFGYFWNSWAAWQRLVIVICGSAASWIIQKVVNDTGGLHNRITQYIHLQPFTLSETAAFLKSRGMNFNGYQIVQMYMAMGGIPHYLKEIQPGKSAVQNINAICFETTGLLKNEFSKLYPALFKHSERHISVIRTLAQKQQGMTREAIIQNAKIPNGGAATTILTELEQSDFIHSYFAFGKKKKEKLFRLSDEYSLFYLKFVEDKTNEGKDVWQRLSQTQTYKIWSGYAFENICLKHINRIKNALGIGGIYSTTSTFLKKGTATEAGTQIDLLIDRNDQVINIFEIKFYNNKFTISKAYADQLRTKMRIFQETTQTNKQLFLTLITTFGLKHNEHSLGLVAFELTLENLFE